jgi:hypothetical protein
LEKRNLKLLFFLGLLVFIAIYIYKGDFDSQTRSVALILIVLGYFTGALAYGVHLVILLIGFILSIPGIAGLYAAATVVAAKIHYYIFGFLLKKTISKTRWYKKNHAKVINSRAYQYGMKKLHIISKRLGIEKPKKVHIFEMEKCPSCGKEIPLSGLYCPKCGKLIDKIRKK